MYSPKRVSAQLILNPLCEAGTLESFLRSSTDAELPELAAWPADVTFVGETEQTDQVSSHAMNLGLQFFYCARLVQLEDMGNLCW